MSEQAAFDFDLFPEEVEALEEAAADVVDLGRPPPAPLLDGDAPEAGDRVDDAARRSVRTPEERRAAVERAIDEATPDRRVRTPEERRRAVEAVLEAREAERRRKRALRDIPRISPPPRPPQGSSWTRSTPPSRKPADPEVDRQAVFESAHRERQVRSEAQRLADAKAAMDELVAQREVATQELNRRLDRLRRDPS